MFLLAVKLTFYDGVDCIGGNKILLEDEDKNTSILLDFGTNFKADGMFFDEFLSPRSTFGLYDMLMLKLLPPVKSFYRADLEFPGMWDKFKESSCFREDVEPSAVLLSHAHLDHNGHISFLSKEIPIYSSAETAVICKVLQDTGGGNRISDIYGITPREVKDGLIQAKHYKKAPCEQRSFRVFGAGSVSDELQSFWERASSSREVLCSPLESCGDAAVIEGLKVKHWQVDHSIPGACAFGIETSAGWIVYTGDLRLHGKKSHLTRNFMKEAAKLKPAVLICEGTHPETKKPVTEQEVFENSLEASKKEKGLVVADFAPRNIERLLSFLDVAKETGRKLVLTPKDIYLLEGLNAAGKGEVPDPLKDPQIAVYFSPKSQIQKWEKELREYAAGKAVVAEDVRKHPDEYILCFSYYDFPALLDIDVKGGTYIYSSSEAFDEEMAIDHRRVENWISFFGFTLYGKLGRDREDSGFHASGHIHGQGLMELVETINPEVLIPVHTENKSFFEKMESRFKIIFPQKGNSYVF